MINRKKFYDSIRQSLFGGKISVSQVEGIEAVLNEWEASNLTDLRWLAYMLATDYWETGRAMQAIKERGGNTYFIKRYWTNVKIRNELGNLSPEDAIKYAGKGLVQITGRNNYKKLGKILGIDLINNPDLALNLPIATRIMFEGMTTGKSAIGDFTNKHLGNFFNKTTEDWIGARRIINGTDANVKISQIAKKFYEALV